MKLDESRLAMWRPVNIHFAERSTKLEIGPGRKRPADEAPALSRRLRGWITRLIPPDQLGEGEMSGPQVEYR